MFCLGCVVCFLGVGASFLLFVRVDVKCCVSVAVCFRICALVPAQHATLLYTPMSGLD